MHEDFAKTMIRINDGMAKREGKKCKAKQKEHYDQNRKSPIYKMNDLVLHWNEVYPPKSKDKLTMHWQEPHRVIKALNEENNFTIMITKHPNSIHDANVDKIMRFIPKKD